MKLLKSINTLHVMCWNVLQQLLFFCLSLSNIVLTVTLVFTLWPLSLTLALSPSPSGLSGFRARLHSSSSVPNFLKFLAPVVESDDSCDSQRKRYCLPPHFHPSIFSSISSIFLHFLWWLMGIINHVGKWRRHLVLIIDALLVKGELSVSFTWYNVFFVLH